VTVVVTAIFHPVEGRTTELTGYAIHDVEDGTITMIEKWDARRLRHGPRGQGARSDGSGAHH
jgi:hypothetical protein